MPELNGKSIGRYNLLEQIGSGGMAIVYKALDTRLDSPVAVKVLRTERLSLEVLDRTLKRFANEARSVARLNHPNLVKVMDYGEYDGRPYLVMPYFPGGTLKEKMGKPMPWREAVALLLPIAEALDYAHSQNMIHRDVKPSNILLTERGHPMLSDFGLAKMLEEEPGSNSLSSTSGVLGVGTPEYMAPEQWSGKVSPQTDIYALGLVLYELITGRKPYEADTPAELHIKQANELPPPPRQLIPDLPVAVEETLLKTLAKKPEDRFQNMGELSTTLKRLLDGKAESQSIAEPMLQKSQETTSVFIGKINLRTYDREIEKLNDQDKAIEAIAHCVHILKTFPKHLETNRLLGKAFLQGEHYNEAVDKFSRVLLSVPDDFVSHVGMSIINDNQNKLDNAIWHMERAFESQPSNAAIQSEMQRLYGRRDGREPPKIRLTRGALAHMYVQGELYTQAIGEIRSVLAEEPNRTDMQVLLALAYFRGGHKVEASETCSQLIGRFPYCLDANRILVDILVGTGMADEAKTCRQRVIELDPYAAFTNGSIFLSDEVSDAVVNLKKRE